MRRNRAYKRNRQRRRGGSGGAGHTSSGEAEEEEQVIAAEAAAENDGDWRTARRLARQAIQISNTQASQEVEEDQDQDQELIFEDPEAAMEREIQSYRQDEQLAEQSPAESPTKSPTDLPAESPAKSPAESLAELPIKQKQGGGEDIDSQSTTETGLGQQLRVRQMGSRRRSRNRLLSVANQEIPTRSWQVHGQIKSTRVVEVAYPGTKRPP